MFVALIVLVKDHKELSSGNANVTFLMLGHFKICGVEEKSPSLGYWLRYDKILVAAYPVA
jgi:hypothetical protein